MPWLEDDTPLSVTDADANRKVPSWPRDETGRIDPRFRQLYGVLMPAPRAMRHLFRCDAGIPSPSDLFNCWVDLVPVSDTVLQGNSGPHPDEGWIVTLTVTNYQSPAVDPNFGKSGIEYRWNIDNPGESSFDRWEMFDKDAPAYLALGIPFELKRGFGFIEPLNGTDWDPVVDLWYPANPITSYSWWTMSECWKFEELPEEGAAEFNGVDSYIKNRTRTIDTTGAWRQEFDVRLHAVDLCDYLCKSFNTTRYCRIGLDRIMYNNRVVFFTTSLVLGTWYHIDFRFQWDAADGLYRVAIDGGADDTAANSNINLKWDQFGKRGTQLPRGEYDFKNFVLRNGTASSSVVYLDQKMQVNACDDGPDGRDGDTFNMTLPSCP